MAGQKPGFRGSPEERFWKKVQKSAGCWVWTASSYPNGYGMFSPSAGELTGAHRFSYRLHFGPIPRRKKVLHTCDNRPCVRPDHLFLGTTRDNLLDAIRKGRFYPNSDRCCPNGHEYTSARRRCEICLRNNEQRRVTRRRTKRAAARAARPALCKNGHSLVGRNVFVDFRGYQKCRECRNAAMRRHRATRSARRRATQPVEALQ